MSDLIIGGVSCTALIIGLVALARYLGLATRYLPAVAAGLGLVCGEAAQYEAGHPDYVIGAFAGLALGLAAAGLFDLGNRTVLNRGATTTPDQPSAPPAA